MTMRKIASATVAVMALSAPAFASSIASSDDLLSKKPALNKNLETGEYDFFSPHFFHGDKFVDQWKFTVASDSVASISLYDFDGTNAFPGAAVPAATNHSRNFDWSQLFDNAHLKLSIFDGSHHLLGQIGEDETLSNLNLLAGGWYTIKVTGRVDGFFGSLYQGVLNLDTAPTPVPLGSTTPLLGSALALLSLRLRKRV